jgi:hypothetical protein
VTPLFVAEQVEKGEEEEVAAEAAAINVFA